VQDDTNQRRHFFDEPANVRLVLRLLFTVCATVFCLDLVSLLLRFAGRHELRHAETAWEGLPGFYAIFGFVACVALVLAAKQMRKLLMRDEDYYDR
jgi:hypothetical protein